MIGDVQHLSLHALPIPREYAVRPQCFGWSGALIIGASPSAQQHINWAKMYDVS